MYTVQPDPSTVVISTYFDACAFIIRACAWVPLKAGLQQTELSFLNYTFEGWKFLKISQPLFMPWCLSYLSAFAQESWQDLFKYFMILE